MRAAFRGGLRDLLLAQERLRANPLRYLFVFGHMRSGSSVLMHVLNSHPEISGFGESWVAYDRPEKLAELAFLVHARLRRPFLTETYVADKILHDDLFVYRDLLRLPNVTSIFLVREPERALKSLYANRHRLLRISNWQSALDHYEARLGWMTRTARFVADRRRCLFIAYENLVESPKRPLAAAAALLGLRAGFSETYRVTPLTGLAGIGDFTPHIRAGRIVRTSAPTALEPPLDVLRRAREAHERCMATLSEACTVSGAPPSPDREHRLL